MHLDGPIALADAAADYIDWAHQISGRHCQCTGIGMGFMTCMGHQYG